MVRACANSAEDTDSWVVPHAGLAGMDWGAGPEHQLCSRLLIFQP